MTTSATIPDLGCGIAALKCNFAAALVELFLPHGQCTDMTGAIALGERIDPYVRAIHTFSGDKRDAVYLRIDGEWRGYPAQATLVGPHNESLVPPRKLVPPHAGQWVLTVKKNGKVNYQCQVISVEGDGARVQLYSWIMGEPTKVVTLTADDLKDCRAFETHDEWLRAARRG